VTATSAPAAIFFSSLTYWYTQSASEYLNGETATAM
jgi:hypothetical protein